MIRLKISKRVGLSEYIFEISTYLEGMCVCIYNIYFRIKIYDKFILSGFMCLEKNRR